MRDPDRLGKIGLNDIKGVLKVREGGLPGKAVSSIRLISINEDHPRNELQAQWDLKRDTIEIGLKFQIGKACWPRIIPGN